MTDQFTLVTKREWRTRNWFIAALVGVLLFACATRPDKQPTPGTDPESIAEYAHFRCLNEGGLVELMGRADGTFYFECKSGHAEFKPRRQAPGTVTPKPPAPVPLPGKPGITA